MQISTEVLNVLSRCRAEGNILFLADQLDRSIYVKTNKVLEAAGGKWNRKEQAHIFTADAAERIEQIILTGTFFSWPTSSTAAFMLRQTKCSKPPVANGTEKSRHIFLRRMQLSVSSKSF
ncbi:hypothetical protein ACE2DQ_004255 [Salmonella enterica]